MKPGDKITITEKLPKTGGTFKTGEQSGSVGCLVRSWDPQTQESQDFFTTALHVAGADNPDAPLLGRQVYNADQTVRGKIVAKTSNVLDTCLVQIEEGSVGPGANSVAGVNMRPIRITGVWDPADILERQKKAPSLDEIKRIQQETMDVSHIGATLESMRQDQMGEFNGKLQFGLTDEVTRLLPMKGRATYAGDSGGPVYTKEGILVGFIRGGSDKGESEATDVVIAYYVFKELAQNVQRELLILR
jgi:hypothetical protein